MFVALLSTVLSLLACIVATIMAFMARESAQKAEHSEHRLAIMRGQVRGLEVMVTALDAAHRKLAGRVYADEYWRGKNELQGELEPRPLDPSTFRNLPECANWRTAQRDGPASPAAGCECDYCNERRADRAMRRVKLRAGVKS